MFLCRCVTERSSWPNGGKLTEGRLRRGAFRSVGQMEAAIHEFLNACNEEPTPFVWSASVGAILEKAGRCGGIVETVH